jgi:hypothetical protein
VCGVAITSPLVLPSTAGARALWCAQSTCSAAIWTSVPRR